MAIIVTPAAAQTQAPAARAQPPASAPIPPQLERLVATEREFAARALAVGWKEAFLEYFDYGAVGFDGGQAGLARDHIRASPDPPPDLQVLWEPRFGDIAASGDVGYLTGPVRRIRPGDNKGQPRHSVYFSIWKRQRDGTFRVVMDVGSPTPQAAPFPSGFTRAPTTNRFTGDFSADSPTLDGADRVLNSALRSGQASAYRGRLAEGARLHRPNAMPAIGERAILARLASQRAFTASDTRYAEAARSGDLGYTWGNYTAGPRGAAKPERGFYVRVWVRERGGQWKVALDVLQPQ